MKRFFLVLLLVALVLLLAAVTHGATEITLDEVDGILSGDTVLTCNTLRFILRFTYTPGDGRYVRSFYNAIRVWTHQNGVYTDNFEPATQDTLPVTPCWQNMFDFSVGCHSYGVDGIGEDTLAFDGRASLMGNGLPDGFDQQAWWIATTPTGGSDTLCIDSCYDMDHWPYTSWVWGIKNGPWIVPGWSGPHCFHVAENCIGSLGNVDLQGGVNIADLVMLATYLFLPDTDLPCIGSGDVDGSGQVNVADVSYLNAYLFHGGPAPPPCP